MMVQSNFAISQSWQWRRRISGGLHTNIRKVERLIQEFQSTLDDKYPVSKDFNNVYTYLHRRLVEANIKKDKEILEEVLEHLRTMRDAWKEVMQATCNGNKLHVS